MTGHAHPLDKFKLIRFTFVLILLAYGKSGFTETMVIDDMKIFNGQVEKEEFCENTSTKWCFVSDKVMGGVSEGSLELIKNDATTYYKMKGNVSTKNNGGFLQFRTELNSHPSGKLFKGVRIKVRGNNEEYAIHLRTKYLFLPWQYYESKFKVSDDWQTIELALVVAIEMYSQNLNKEALEFIENCCYDTINSSEDPLQLFKYGILLERNGKIKSSEKIIQKSLDISNNSYPYILNYLAYLWVDNNRNLEKAEKMLTKAVEDSNYQDGAIIDSLGWLYFKKGDLKLAEKWISDAYRLEPSEPEIIDHLSQIYLKLGRYKEAKFLDNKILLFHQDYFKIDEIKERNENP